VCVFSSSTHSDIFCNCSKSPNAPYAPPRKHNISPHAKKKISLIFSAPAHTSCLRQKALRTSQHQAGRGDIYSPKKVDAGFPSTGVVQGQGQGLRHGPSHLAHPSTPPGCKRALSADLGRWLDGSAMYMLVWLLRRMPTNRSVRGRGPMSRCGFGA